MEKDVLQRIKNLTVLYVEDEEKIRQKIADTLRFYVKRVIEARDGLEGFDKYKKHRPDIIFSDILMPNMDGLSMTKKIRQVDTTTPISLITAHTDKDMLLQAVKLHLEEYLVKPVTFDDILKILISTCKKFKNTFTLPNSKEYDFENKTINKDGKSVILTKKESIFLELLIRHEKNVVSYDELQTHVWVDEVMSDNALRTLVYALRQKIGKNAIKNISGFGYKLEI